MVIRPSDIKKLKLSKEFEKDIDNCLKSGQRTYSLTGIKQEIAHIILIKYSKAGWKVKLVSDHRDGDYLQFSE